MARTNKNTTNKNTTNKNHLHANPELITLSLKGTENGITGTITDLAKLAANALTANHITEGKPHFKTEATRRHLAISLLKELEKTTGKKIDRNGNLTDNGESWANVDGLTRHKIANAEWKISHKDELTDLRKIASN